MPNPHWSALHLTVEQLDLERRSKDLVLLDVRFRPGQPSRRPDYLAAHIPGARFVDLVADFGGTARDGHNPRGLPDRNDLQNTLRSWGIDDHSAVVVYGDASPFAAARVWWVLTWFGHSNVRVLDGGINVWTAAGLPVATGEEPAPRTGSITLGDGGSLPTVSLEHAQALAEQGRLFDARPPAVYAGTPGDLSGGHIPGALNLPSQETVTATGSLLPKTQLPSLDEDAADAAVGVYCGGGLAAAHQVLTLRAQGVDAALLLESWSGWTATEQRPVAYGEGRWGNDTHDRADGSNAE